MSAFCRLDITGIEPELSAPAPERLLAGDPQFRSWNVEDSGDGVYAGVWESTPGHWRIEMALGEHERERHHILTSPLSLYFCGAS